MSIKKNLHLMAIILLACIVFFFTFWTIVYENQWFERVLILYAILTVFIIVLYYSKTHKILLDSMQTVVQSEKTKRGDLYHIHCPKCNERFAIKKSKDVIPTHKQFDKIPKKEVYKFKCPNCDRYFSIKISKTDSMKSFSLTCPNCGIVGKISSPLKKSC